MVDLCQDRVVKVGCQLPGWSGCGPRCGTAGWSRCPSSSDQRSRGSDAPNGPLRCWVLLSCWRRSAWPSLAASSQWSASCRQTSSRIPAVLSGLSSTQATWGRMPLINWVSYWFYQKLSPLLHEGMYVCFGSWTSFPFNLEWLVWSYLEDGWWWHKPWESPLLVLAPPFAWVCHESSPGSQPG